MQTALLSSASMYWNTPPDLAQEIAAFLGGIDLDPCPDAAQQIPAVHHALGDGLAIAWHGKVFVNPPYGRTIGAWVRKALTSSASEVVLLLPARTDTQWFQPLFDHAICFVRGRLHFSGAAAGAPFPSALVYIGPRSSAFLQAFQQRGVIVQRCTV